MNIKHLAASALLYFGSVNSFASDYTNHPKAQAFIETMVKEHGFDKKAIQTVLAKAEKKQSILDAISRPAEKTKPWYEYRNIFLGADRIEQGVEFWTQNQETLSAVAEQYGVEPEVIVAIIGVETRYGRYMGKYRVLDALTTLGFDYPRRGKFFTSQLEQFFILTREQNKEPAELLGSYAGAMGFGQFIPSSYRRYARDFNGDGFVDIWTNKDDAIASVANYFKAHGWQKGKPVFASLSAKAVLEKADVNTSKRPSVSLAAWDKKGIKTADDFNMLETNAVILEYEAKSGPEHMFGLNNFYVITRYNRSRMYARAVWELSQEIASAYTTAQVK